MCLIIAPNANGTKALLPRDAFDYAFNRNKDGFGAMWTEDGRVRHFKTLGLTGDEIYAYMEEYVEKYPDVIFHLRLKTHGKVTPSLCHPFRLLHKSRHGKDLFFMHNGVFSGFGSNLTYGQSDTTAFKDKVLIPLLTRNPDALDDPAVMNSINKMTAGSRLIFLDSEGKTWRTAGGTWNDDFGPVCSNTYMLPNKPYVPYTGKYGGKYPDNDYGKVVSIGKPKGKVKEKDGLMYNLWRMVQVGTNERGHWCAQVAPGYVRTETGLLYKDRGLNVMLKHSLDYIPKDQELQHIAGWVPASLEDDELPWDEDTLAEHTQMYVKETTIGDAIASKDEQLRYARIVHNAQNGSIECREQLMGDLIGMSTDEMEGFIKEDPSNAHTIMAELIEIICEFNDGLMQTKKTEKRAFDVEKIMELGSLTNHQESMKRISAIRAARYKKKLEERTEEKETTTVAAA